MKYRPFLDNFTNYPSQKLPFLWKQSPCLITTRGKMWHLNPLKIKEQLHTVTVRDSIRGALNLSHARYSTGELHPSYVCNLYDKYKLELYYPWIVYALFIIWYQKVPGHHIPPTLSSCSSSPGKSCTCLKVCLVPWGLLDYFYFICTKVID